MVKAISPKVIITKIIFIRLILVRYFEARDLSLATSLTVNGWRPKSAKTPKIPVKARAKERIPKPAAPR
ncbi:hypothetical protein ES703_85263 [subsurface metagenome]